jgi:uncharacterized protein (PEP-CTERM system associated)
VGFVALACLSDPAIAAVWEVSPSVSLGVTHTDNVLLQAAPRESDTTVQATPGVDLTGRGVDSRVNLSYRLYSQRSFQDADRDELSQQLRTSLDTEMVRDLFYVTAAAGVERQVEDPTGPIDLGQSGTINRRDVTTMTIHPYLQKDLATWDVRMLLGYQYDKVGYEGSEPDSATGTGEISLASGPSDDAFAWSLRYALQRVRYDDDRVPDRRFERIDLDTRYRLTPEVHLLAAAGEENNEYEHADVLDAPEGRSWSGGIAWFPTPRTQMEARYGKRFFGTTRYAQVSHQAARVRLGYTHSEDITTRRQEQVQRTTFLLTDEAGNPVLDQITGQPILAQIEAPVVVDEVFVQRRNSASVGLVGTRTFLNLEYFNERRHYQTSNTRERTNGASAGFNWQMAGRTQLEAQVVFSKTDFFDGSRTDLRIQSLSIERPTGIRSALYGAVRHSDQIGSGGAGDYEANVVTLGFSWRY